MNTVKKKAERDYTHGAIEVTAGQEFDCPEELVERFEILGVFTPVKGGELDLKLRQKEMREAQAQNLQSQAMQGIKKKPEPENKAIKPGKNK